MTKIIDRPEVVTDEMLEYLDNLRDSGVTNMFGATPYLERSFNELDYDTSGDVLSYWMKSFGEDDR